jgi:hypothetical protein
MKRFELALKFLQSADEAYEQMQAQIRHASAIAAEDPTGDDDYEFNEFVAHGDAMITVNVEIPHGMDHTDYICDLRKDLHDLLDICFPGDHSLHDSINKMEFAKVSEP